MTVRGLDRGERCALLISECQQGMIVEKYRGARDELARQAENRQIVPAIAELAEAFRRAAQPVVHSHLVPRADWSGFKVNCALAGVLRRANIVCEGKPGAEPHPGLRPQPGDFVVRRPTGLTSFYGTEVDALLRAEDVRTVVVAGVSTNIAVFGSVLEAVNRGYSVVVPADCIAGIGESQHVVQMQLLPLLATVTDRTQVISALTARASAPAGAGA
jgi:nicotinamidase-related amidase